LLEISNMDKNLATIIVFDNGNKAIFTKHITNCSFNNDPSGLLMNMTSTSNKHPLYNTWQHSYLPKRKLVAGVNMGVVVRWHLSVYIQNKKHKEKSLAKSTYKHYTLNKQKPAQSNRILPRPYLSLDWDPN
jgi:hypothetical protein